MGQKKSFTDKVKEHLKRNWKKYVMVGAVVGAGIAGRPYYKEYQTIKKTSTHPTNDDRTAINMMMNSNNSTDMKRFAHIIQHSTTATKSMKQQAKNILNTM